MVTTEQIIIALALAMDCFSVSLATGIMQRRVVLKTITVMSLLFGLFQALMPVIGWLGVIFFKSSIESIDHWIAFGLLCFIGIRMIRDGKKDDEPSFNPDKVMVLLLLAVATSIDALAVGISYVCIGLTTFESICQPVIIIGLVSFLMSILGYLVGVGVGHKLNLPADIIGGSILIIIGIKILLEHIL